MIKLFIFLLIIALNLCSETEFHSWIKSSTWEKLDVTTSYLSKIQAIAMDGDALYAAVYSPIDRKQAVIKMNLHRNHKIASYQVISIPQMEGRDAVDIQIMGAEIAILFAEKSGQHFHGTNTAKPPERIGTGVLMVNMNTYAVTFDKDMKTQAAFCVQDNKLYLTSSGNKFGGIRVQLDPFFQVMPENFQFSDADVKAGWSALSMAMVGADRFLAGKSGGLFKIDSKNNVRHLGYFGVRSPFK